MKKTSFSLLLLGAYLLHGAASQSDNRIRVYSWFDPFDQKRVYSETKPPIEISNIINEEFVLNPGHYEPMTQNSNGDLLIWLKEEHALLKSGESFNRNIYSNNRISGPAFPKDIQKYSLGGHKLYGFIKKDSPAESLAMQIFNTEDAFISEEPTTPNKDILKLKQTPGFVPLKLNASPSELAKKGFKPLEPARPLSPAPEPSAPTKKSFYTRLKEILR